MQEPATLAHHRGGGIDGIEADDIREALLCFREAAGLVGLERLGIGGERAVERGAWLGAVAVGLAAVNTFGGFLVSQRMLEMFKKKDGGQKSSSGHK